MQLKLQKVLYDPNIFVFNFIKISKSKNVAFYADHKFVEMGSKKVQEKSCRILGFCTFYNFASNF
jgi:hypothetical protein